MRMLIDSINPSYLSSRPSNQYFFSGQIWWSSRCSSFLLILFLIDAIVFFFIIWNRSLMSKVLQKVVRLISRTDFSSRNTVQFFFLVSWIRVGWCAKKEWRMRKKQKRFLSTMTRLDFDLSVFRLNSFLQSRLLWFFLPFSTFLSFFFIPARFSLFPFNWHLSFPSVRAFFHLFACLLPHTPPTDFSVFSFSVVSHPPVLRRCPRIRIPHKRGTIRVNWMRRSRFSFPRPFPLSMIF